MGGSPVLRLSAPLRGLNHGYLDDSVDDDNDKAAQIHHVTTPYATPPTTPKQRAISEPLGEVLAAVPFAWELVPGTPKSRARNASSSSSSDAEGSSESLGSSSEFEFSSLRLDNEGECAPKLSPCRNAEELFSNGRLLPLRLPPRLQSFGNPSLSPPPPPLLKKSTTPSSSSMCSPRSLSPLRLFSRRESRSSSSSSSSSSFSSASSSSSYSSALRKHHGDPFESEAGTTTLKHLFWTDAAVMRTGNSPRVVHTRREISLRAQEEQWNGFAAPAPFPDPGRVSRSHARLSVQAEYPGKQRVGSANKFGMMRSCMGMAFPGSP